MKRLKENPNLQFNSRVCTITESGVGLSVSVVIPARNEANHISKTLEALISQDYLKEIVVVNDGSNDETADLCRKFKTKVVDTPPREYDAGGMPQLARVINLGIEEIEKNLPKYIMIIGADHIIPVDYIKTLFEKMELNQSITVASGIIKGENTREFAARGSGRIVRVSWWRNYGLRYPEAYGWEAWMIFRALKDTKEVLVERELEGSVQRPTGSGLNRVHNWGKAMKALNYWKAYALARIALQFLRSPNRGLAMFRGYLSDVDKLEDITDFVPSFQKKYVRSLLFSGARRN